MRSLDRKLARGSMDPGTLHSQTRSVCNYFQVAVALRRFGNNLPVSDQADIQEGNHTLFPVALRMWPLFRSRGLVVDSTFKGLG